MSTLPRHWQTAPFRDALPSPIWFRSADMPAHAAYPRHRHPWGEFVCAFSGVMELQLGERHYLAPPQYGIWLPPGVEHQGLNRHAACHGSLYVAPEWAGGLPREACALTVSPLVRALLEHLRLHPPGRPPSPADERLLRVLLDQLAVAGRAGSYLPSSDDPLLSPVLQALQADPGDPRPLAGLARAVHTTERTLMRRAQRELGMSLAEWRQRLCVVHAMPRLVAGETVENIAHDLGYGSASAFIAMFRRRMGTTPDGYRRGVDEGTAAAQGFDGPRTSDVAGPGHRGSGSAGPPVPPPGG